MTKDPLSAKVKGIQDILRKDAGIDGDAQRISQISILLFLKAVSDTNYSDTLLGKFNWKKLTLVESGKYISTLESIIDSKAFKEGKIYNSKVESIFEGVNLYFTSESVLKATINKIDDLFGGKDSNYSSKIYEKILSDIQNAGNSGEFYTPNALTEFIAKSISIQDNDSVLDPACGTGGLLISLANEASKSSKYVSLFGVEKKSLPFMLANVNTLLHGLGDEVTLSKGNALSVSSYTSFDREKFSIILSNPPFGGVEESEILSASNNSSKDTSELFISLILDRLDTNGRAAVILPDGFLAGTGNKARLKKRLMEEFSLHTIVRIPSGAFAPYTGITSNILYFDRTSPAENIWFVEHKYPSNIKKYSKTKPIKIEYLEDILEWWDDRVENDFAWKVSREDIIRNDYNLDISNPHKDVIDKIDYEQLFNLIEENESLIDACIDDLAGILYNNGLGDYTKVRNEINAISKDKNGFDSLKVLFAKLAMMGKLTKSAVSLDLDSKKLLRVLNLYGDKIETMEQNLFINTPEHWTHTHLDNIGYIVSGGTPKSDEEQYWSDKAGIPWLTPTDLYNMGGKFISAGSRYITLSGLNSSSARMLPEGTILFSSRAPIGYIAIAGAPLATNQGFKSIIPKIDELGSFVYYYMFAIKDIIERRSSGTTFKEATTRQMKSTHISIPSIEEMMYITTLLDRVFHLLDRTKKSSIILEKYNGILVEQAKNRLTIH